MASFKKKKIKKNPSGSYIMNNIYIYMCVSIYNNTYIYDTSHKSVHILQC